MYHQYRKESNAQVRNASVSENGKIASYCSSEQNKLKALDKKTLLKIWNKALNKISPKESSFG